MGFWTKPRPSLAFMDTAVDATINAVKGSPGAVYQAGKSGLKWGAIAGGAAGLAVLAPFVLGAFRKKPTNIDNEPLPRELTAPLPPVLEYVQPQPQRREVLGPHTAQVLGRQGDGPDVSQPALMQ